MTATREDLRPIAGPNYRRCAALKMDGTKRRKLLCLLAAWTDAGRSGCRAVDLAKHLDWPYLTRERYSNAYTKTGWSHGPTADDGASQTT